MLWKLLRSRVADFAHANCMICRKAGQLIWWLTGVNRGAVAPVSGSGKIFYAVPEYVQGRMVWVSPEVEANPSQV